MAKSQDKTLREHRELIYAKNLYRCPQVGARIAMKDLSHYIFRRLLQTIPQFFGVIGFLFLLIHLAPGDPVLRFIGMAPTTPEYIARIRAEMGLDKPLYVQFIIYFEKLLQGDLGYSLYWHEPVLDVVLRKLPNTVLLMSFALALAILIGILAGVEAARRPHTKWDYIVTSLAVAGYSVPVYWLALVLMLVFAVTLKWFPSGGMLSPGSIITGPESIPEVLHHMILPGIALAASQIPIISRLTRQSTLDALGENYILTARMKGLDPRTIAYKHAFRNSMLPVVTIIGLQIGFFISWSVLAEIVFSWPGLGLLIWWTVGNRDYPVLMGILLIICLMVIAATLIVDIIYTRLDPRITYGGPQ
jgi:peptide/nickel transport system permease protein